jgi:hypothetical protein
MEDGRSQPSSSRRTSPSQRHSAFYSSCHLAEAPGVSEPPKVEFDFWGCRVSAQGMLGIVAAVSVVAMLLAFYRRRRL